MNLEPFKSDLRTVRGAVRWWRARFPTIERRVTDVNGKLVLGPLNDDNDGRIPLPPLPPREVSTRWSSTLSLLAYLQRTDVRKWLDFIQTHPGDLGFVKGARKGRVAVVEAATLDGDDDHEFSTLPNLPPDFDWLGPGFNTVIDLFQLLEPLGRITKLVQSASTPTLASAWLNLVMRLVKWGVIKDVGAVHRKPGRKTLLPSTATSTNTRGGGTGRADEKDENSNAVLNSQEVADLDFRTKAAWDKWAELTTRPLNAKRRSRTPRTLADDYVIDAGDGEYKDVNEIEDDGPATTQSHGSATELLGLTQADLDDADVQRSDAAELVRSVTPKYVHEVRQLVAMRLGDHLQEWLHLQTPAVALAVFLYPYAYSWAQGVMKGKDPKDATQRKQVSKKMLASWATGLENAQVAARQWVQGVPARPPPTTPGHSMMHTVVSDDEDESEHGSGPSGCTGSIGSSDPVGAYLNDVHKYSEMSVIDYWKQGPTELRSLAAKAHGALASSSASERLFSVSGYVGRARRLRLTSANLSTLSVLKANEMWLEKWRELEAKKSRRNGCST
jgi:hypothetical protein